MQFFFSPGFSVNFALLVCHFSEITAALCSALYRRESVLAIFFFLLITCARSALYGRVNLNSCIHFFMLVCAGQHSGGLAA